MTAANATPLPHPTLVKWQHARIRWLPADRFLRRVCFTAGRLVFECHKSSVPDVAYMGESVWRDADGRVWECAMASGAGDVLALWMREVRE